VSYRERQRLADIQAAVDAIRSHQAPFGAPNGGSVRKRLANVHHET
jgi:hypothetical protein